MNKLRMCMNEDQVEFLEGPSFEVSADLSSCPNTAWEVCRVLKFFFARDFVLDNDPDTSAILIALNVVILIIEGVMVGSPCVPFTSYRWFRDELSFWQRLSGATVLRNAGANQFELVKV